MNIAEKLKSIPKDTRLYSPMFGDVFLVLASGDFISIHTGNPNYTYGFNKEGKFSEQGDCMLFPSRENRDWSKFSICPFKDGDVISKTYSDGIKYIAIFSHIGGVRPETLNYHCYVRGNGMMKVVKDYGIGVYTEYKLASEKDREFLFKRLTESGYYWDTCTKSVKLSNLKFKVGDTIHKKSCLNHTIVAIEEDRYRLKNGFFLMFTDQHEWEVVKFSISSLKPFDKVLVRDSDEDTWRCELYSHYCNKGSYKYGCISASFRYCVPYNDETKHLIGTTNECSNYYKTWE